MCSYIFDYLGFTSTNFGVKYYLLWSKKCISSMTGSNNEVELDFRLDCGLGTAATRFAVAP